MDGSWESFSAQEYTMMFRVVLLITVAVVDVAKCDDGMSLRLPPLPAQIEKLFKTKLPSSPIPELNTGHSNRSFELSDEDYTLDGSLSTEEANETLKDNMNLHDHHHHPHHHIDDHARAGKIELSAGDDDDLFRKPTDQDFENTTKGREKEDDTHDHDEEGALIHQLSTANPFRDSDAAEMEKSRRDSVDNLREKNSETDGKDARSGSCTVRCYGKQLLAVTLFVMISLA